ncbi:uncharacterized protein LOC119178716 [Rhipicephalus microplus]|uniref:uncharacterized protein LOC119178716 n=1 Tax=Rhipicephalus microplus TaxID=6941 RepID=UPI003F6BCFB8
MYICMKYLVMHQKMLSLKKPAGCITDEATGCGTPAGELHLCRAVGTGYCQISAKTPTALARGLLTTMFNRHAILTCLMKIKKVKGIHKPLANHPPLLAAGIDAILSFTKSTAIAKGWECS